jgi:ABC-2 type transport system permease protein
MPRMIRVELVKLARRPRNWVSLALLCGLPVLVAVFVVVTHLVPPPGQGPTLLSDVLSSGNLYPAAALAIVLPVFLPIAVAVVGGDSIAGEAGSGMLRYLLARPVGRARLLTAKLVALIVYVMTAVVLVAVTSYLTGIALFGAAPVSAPTGGGTLAAPSPVAAAATSLSGSAISPASLVLRIVGAVAFIGVSMLGVGAIALFLSTLTNSPLAAALGALAALITSQVLVTLNSADAVAPYLPTRYWLAWIDFFREPILWRDIDRGLAVQAVYVVIFLGAAWAHFATKDVTS